MKILLPPSEGKQPGHLSVRYRPATIAPKELAAARRQLLTALVEVSRDAEVAARLLGLSARQTAELEWNRRLRTAPTAPAIEVFNGVLYEALGYQGLTPAAQRKADASLVVFNALTGICQTRDLIPAYRLSAKDSLPGIGNVAGFWQDQMRNWQPGQGELVVDARSSDYQRFWQPAGNLAERTVVLKVMQVDGKGRRLAVSHSNKLYKGRLVRDLLSARRQPSVAEELQEILPEWHLELLPAKPGRPRVCEVVLD